MAKPRIFVSSTFYDLKYIRSSLEQFIDSLGFDPILSEKGGVPYAPDAPLDESCYREVHSSDVYVLIIGGRYGSEASRSRDEPREHDFFSRYESITKQEYNAAVEQDIPIYVLIDRAVHAEFQTFQKNRTSDTINYAHVDSVNVFYFIDHILSQPRNNAVQQFDRYADVESWLREQWAGLFRELLHRMNSQKQIASLASEVKVLTSVNETMKRYLEQVLANVSPNEAAKIIKTESERLLDVRLKEAFATNRFVQFIAGISRIAPSDLEGLFQTCNTPAKFADRVFHAMKGNGESMTTAREASERVARVLTNPIAVEDLNSARAVLGLSPITVQDVDNTTIKDIPDAAQSPTQEPTKPRRKNVKAPNTSAKRR